MITEKFMRFENPSVEELKIQVANFVEDKIKSVIASCPFATWTGEQVNATAFKIIVGTTNMYFHKRIDGSVHIAVCTSANSQTNVNSMTFKAYPQIDATTKNYYVQFNYFEDENAFCIHDNSLEPTVVSKGSLVFANHPTLALLILTYNEGNSGSIYTSIGTTPINQCEWAYNGLNIAETDDKKIYGVPYIYNNVPYNLYALKGIKSFTSGVASTDYPKLYRPTTIDGMGKFVRILPKIYLKIE